MRLRLAAIKYGCDFRKNEWTLYEEVRKDNKYKQVGQLSGGDVILFVSCTGNQLIWLFAQQEEGGHVVVDSRRWRMLSGTWNPDMLGHYANAVGIELVGIRLIESGYKEERDRRAEKRRLKELYEYEPHIHVSIPMQHLKVAK